MGVLGLQEENLRRSRDFESPRSSSSQPRSYSPGTPTYAPQAQSQATSSGAISLYDAQCSSTLIQPVGLTCSWFGAASQPPIMRKPSTDYSSRRSGGQEENQRRSGDYRSPTARRQSSSSYAPDSAPSASPARASQPRIERKRSSDYPSRRPGGEEENLRRSRDFSSPAGGRGVYPA